MSGDGAVVTVVLYRLVVRVLGDVASSRSPENLTNMPSRDRGWRAHEESSREAGGWGNLILV